jgi:hypothetical protein
MLKYNVNSTIFAQYLRQKINHMKMVSAKVFWYYVAASSVIFELVNEMCSAGSFSDEIYTRQSGANQGKT